MWQKLKEIHSKSAPNTRFNSLSSLFNIRLRDDESLVDLGTCIEGTMQHIQALHPPTIIGPSRLTSSGYTLQMLNNKLLTMAMLCTLPHDNYTSFISSVLLLNSLTKDNILEAFQIEETQQSAAKEDAEIATTTAAYTISCFICNGPHKVQDCPSLSTACENAKKTNGNKSKKHGNHCGAKANATKAADTPKVEDRCNGPAVRVEVATNQESPLVWKPLPLPLPSPYPELSPEQPLWDIDVADIDKHGEQEVALALNCESNNALLLAGCAFVKDGAEFGGYGVLMANAAVAYKVGTHDINPHSYKEAMASKNAIEWYKAMIEYSVDTAAQPSSPFIAFSDADHGGNMDNGHSTTGSVLTVAGGMVSWISKQQTIVALSTTEANCFSQSFQTMSPKISMLGVHPNGHGSRETGKKLTVGFGPDCPDYAQIVVASSAGWAWGKRIGVTSTADSGKEGLNCIIDGWMVCFYLS
ncbi:hypothetical protein E4T56_gene558 [Termitomyces sp. T112]|nr:hypothetical protein E4T56_gene558 [Termitomyces sp. T112]